MSSAQKSANKSSSKSGAMFALNNVDSLLSSRSGKKDTPRPSHIPESKPVTTRAKSVATKRKKPSEPEGEPLVVERHLHEVIFESMARLKNNYEDIMKELLKELANMRSIAAAKDKRISRLTKEKKVVEEELLLAQLHTHDQVANATEDARMWAAKSVFQARIKMAKEAGDPEFDSLLGTLPSGNRLWQQIAEDEGKAEAIAVAIHADQVGASGMKEGEEMAAGGVDVGNEG